MNAACCLLVAAAVFTAWYRNEYIVVTHLHLLIGLSSTIIIDAYLHSLASPLYPQHKVLGVLIIWLQRCGGGSIPAAMMLRPTAWSIVTTHIDSNELYEDLIVMESLQKMCSPR